MKILRILNNNVVIVLNEDNEEVILTGNGLGFQKKPGTEVDNSKIEKVFELKNQVETEQIKKLFSEIPEEIIDISYKTISNAKKILNKELNETSFIAIADHLHSSIQRSRKNIQVKNFLLWDIKRFFPEELEIARETIRTVNYQLNAELSDDEAGFLALHITNAEIDSNHDDAVSLTQLIEEILTVIKYTLRINFVENDIYFQRFITHLKFFSERVLRDNPVDQEENQIENELFSLVSKQYPEAFEATKKVSELLKTRRDYDISKDEQVYITIHLARIIEKNCD
ncbi:PRD domain-containing protein [Enterococcus sp. BWT-B8]|uniref:BglG family transcription antiterminator LicT n=1 Tax=unclassified Enterococcus TaxID=2608891 RepID=UPI001E5BACEA|nr:MULTISPECIES: PRD domain-containing protein [unclassified Enterococcus]MCB5952606.1 PRD domain-containing protein [Enterococcus sp. BWT-B8]MCB5956296.1 PRD domain-containing protein [Enterococcus sp. CWB-B31]